MVVLIVNDSTAHEIWDAFYKISSFSPVLWETNGISKL